MACNAQSEPGVDETGFETGTYTMGFSISGIVVKGDVVYRLLLSGLVGAFFSVLSVIFSLLFPVRFSIYLLTFHNWAKQMQVGAFGQVGFAQFLLQQFHTHFFERTAQYPVMPDAGKTTRQNISYNPPSPYLFLDQKRKMRIAKELKKQIAKFDIKLT